MASIRVKQTEYKKRTQKLRKTYKLKVPKKFLTSTRLLEFLRLLELQLPKGPWGPPKLQATQRKIVPGHGMVTQSIVTNILRS
jgi:hypothetical protein